MVFLIALVVENMRCHSCVLIPPFTQALHRIAFQFASQSQTILETDVERALPP